MLAYDVVGLERECAVVGSDSRLCSLESEQQLGARRCELMAVRKAAVEAVEEGRRGGCAVRLGDGRWRG